MHLVVGKLHGDFKQISIFIADQKEEQVLRCVSRMAVEENTSVVHLFVPNWNCAFSIFVVSFLVGYESLTDY